MKSGCMMEILPMLGSIQVTVVPPSRQQYKVSLESSSSPSSLDDLQPSSLLVRDDSIVLQWGSPETSSFLKIGIPFEVEARRIQSYNSVPGEMIEFRLPMKPQGLQNFRDSLSKYEEKVSRVKDKNWSNIRCRFCKNAILTEEIERRILELPSDSWFELVENCSCHPDHYITTHPHEGEIDSKPKTILVGDGFYQIDWTDIKIDSIVLESRRVSCKRCDSPLGKTSFHNHDGHPAYVKFDYFLSEAYPDKSIPIKKLVAERMRLKCKDDSIYRFVIRGASTKTNFLYIWLFNMECFLYTTIPFDEPNIENPKFGSPVHGNTRFKKYLKVFFNELDISPPEQREGQEKINLNEEGIEVINLREEDCYELLLSLTNSNIAVPPSKRVMNGMKVGFICVE